MVIREPGPAENKVDLEDAVVVVHWDQVVLQEGENCMVMMSRMEEVKSRWKPELAERDSAALGV